MIVGIPKEVKVQEYRVSMVPGGVKKLVDRGHKVIVQKGAGLGSGLPDDLYLNAGAEIVDDIESVYRQADMIIKVKEPIEMEYGLIRENQIIYTYLHLAACKQLTEKLMETNSIDIAYETIEMPDGSLPLLTPMSEVAGRMSIQAGATCLQKEHGGKGILLGGVPGVRRGRVTIIGGGVAGKNATKMAIGLGANVDLLDIDMKVLDYFDDVFGNRVNTLYSNHDTIHQSVVMADLVIGAVLVTGAKAPNLVSEELVKEMEDGSVLVDISIDQGGCIETMKPTTHENPTFIKHGVIHYGVANIPGAVAQTSTFALTNATLGYALLLADLGADEAMRRDPALARGANIYKGQVVCEPVAVSLDLPYTPLADLI